MSAESLKDYPDVDDWIVVAPDGRIVVRTGKVDIGQRISTALALIAAEELDVDFQRVDVEMVDTALSPDEEYTSASNSVERSGNAIRLASATARRHLLALAAKELEVEPQSLQIRDGLVGSSATNRTTTYWDIMQGQRFSIAVDPHIEPKAAQDYRQVGRAVVAMDLAELVRGQPPVRSRHAHARNAARPARAAAALSCPHRVDRRKHPSPSRWRAPDARRQLRGGGGGRRISKQSELPSVWPPPYAGRRHEVSTRADVFERLVTAPRVSLPVRDGHAFEEPAPELAPPPAQAAITINTRIERPYLMHGSIGPSAALALFENGDLTIWTHTQGVYPLRLTIAEWLGMDPARVRLVQRRGPGAYGHNGADDAALDAALVARCAARKTGAAQMVARRRARVGTIWPGHGGRDPRKPRPARAGHRLVARHLERHPSHASAPGAECDRPRSNAVRAPG